MAELETYGDLPDGVQIIRMTNGRYALRYPDGFVFYHAWRSPDTARSSFMRYLRYRSRSELEDMAFQSSHRVDPETWWQQHPALYAEAVKYIRKYFVPGQPTRMDHIQVGDIIGEIAAERGIPGYHSEFIRYVFKREGM